MAGIGGGGVVVPLCMVFFGFTTKDAICISGFSILVCQTFRYIYTFNQLHPEKNTVAIDYGLACVMLPTVLMGSFVGVTLNVMFPALVIQIIMTLLLIVLSI
jgi:uncharacterized membrane protein YfcA